MTASEVESVAAVLVASLVVASLVVASLVVASAAAASVAALVDDPVSFSIRRDKVSGLSQECLVPTNPNSQQDYSRPFRRGSSHLLPQSGLYTSTCPATGRNTGSRS